MKLTEQERKRWHQQYQQRQEQRRKELMQGTARSSSTERALVQRHRTSK